MPDQFLDKMENEVNQFYKEFELSSSGNQQQQQQGNQTHEPNLGQPSFIPNPQPPMMQQNNYFVPNHGPQGNASNQIQINHQPPTSNMMQQGAGYPQNMGRQPTPQMAPPYAQGTPSYHGTPQPYNLTTQPVPQSSQPPRLQNYMMNQSTHSYSSGSSANSSVVSAASVPVDQSLMNQSHIRYQYTSVPHHPNHVPLEQVIQAKNMMNQQKSPIPKKKRTRPQSAMNKSLNSTRKTTMNTSNVSEKSNYSLNPQLRIRQNRHNMDAIKDRLKREEEKKCTFKPKINKKFQSSKAKLSRSERLKRLSAPVDRSSLAHRKQKLEEERLKECTFEPNVNNKISRKPRVDVENVVDRLNGTSRVDKIAERQITKRLKEEQELAKYQNKPKRKKDKFSKKVQGTAPLHERVGDIQRARHNEQIRLRIQHEREQLQQYAYQPKISDASRKLATQKFQNKSFHERVEIRLQERDMNHSMVSQFDEPKKSMKKKNFKVKGKSKKILENTPLYSDSVDFLERQQMMAARKEQKKQMMEEALSNEYNYRPKISKQSKRIAGNMRAEEDPVERLTFRDVETRRMKAELLKKAHEEKNSFQPKLNPISLKLGRPSNSSVLYGDPEREKRKNALKERMEKEKSKVYTFAPQTNAKSSKLAAHSQYRVENYEQQAASREEYIHQQRQMQQYNEIRGCTFNPKLISKNAASSPNDEPIRVAGLANHLHRYESAAQQRFEKSQREAQVFKTKSSTPRRPYTIPEPFNLTGGTRERETARDKWIAHEMEECTFQPQTNPSLLNILF